MAGLEAVLRITAKDDTAAALAEIKKRIEGIDKSVETLDKFVSSVGRVTRATDPLASSLLSAQKALASQRVEIAGVVAGLDRLTGPTDRAAAAQRTLARQVEVTTGALARQGSTAARAAGQVASAARRAAGGAGGARGGHGGGYGIGGVVPFAGPMIEHGVVQFLEAGATTEEEIARLKAAGAKQEEIDKARDDWRKLSKTHSGVRENEYLAGYRGARVIAPGEAYEMAESGAKYRLGLRNSGISSSENDVENVLKIMDELGLKSDAERNDFIDQTLKTQQTFGSQIKTETMLAAYRNAKQSIYDWSPNFRNRYFPTLLQVRRSARGNGNYDSVQ